MLKGKRLVVPVAMLATLAVAASAPASTSHGTLIKQRNTKLGQLLVSRRGHLLYLFKPDSRNKDVCVTKRLCTQVWPPVTTKGNPVAGTGISQAKLGTIKLPNGKRQVTYHGHPLYTYIADKGGGDTSYVGRYSTGGRWWAITASGQVVKHQ